MKWAVIVLIQHHGFVMKYEKINISHLGICYSYSIVSPYLPYQHLGLSVSLSLRNEKMFVLLYVNENLICKKYQFESVTVRKSCSYNRNITLAKLWEKSYWFCQGDMLMRIEIGFLSDKRHETLSSGLCSEDWKYVENNILSRSSAWLEHASHIREDFGSIPMWRCNWIILHIREFFNILFVGWLVINRQ